MTGVPDLHEVVLALLGRFSKTNHGLGLTPDVMRQWFHRVRNHSEWHNIGVDLLKAAKGFSKHEDMEFAATEFVGLAVALLGQETAAELMSHDGIDPAQSVSLINKGKKAIKNLTDGLEKNPSTGIRLRPRKKF